MQKLLDILRRDALWPVYLALVAVLVLLVGISSFGLWEPQEIKLADDARAAHAQTGAAAAEAPPGKAPAEPKLPQVLPFERWVIGQGLATAGSSELGARLPLALLGIGLVLACYYLGSRIASRRAGLIAGLVATSMPLLVFQARQLTSDIGTAAGQTFLVAGLVGLAWPSSKLRSLGAATAAPGGRSSTATLLDLAGAALLVLLGGAIAATSGGILLGLVPPLAAVAVAGGGVGRSVRAAGRWLQRAALSVAAALRPRVAIGRHPAGEAAAPLPEDAQPWRAVAVSLLTLAATLAVLAVFFVAVFQLREPVPGERALFGKSLLPRETYVDLIGGTWKLRDDLNATFDTLFEQIAYGMFPWSALAPIALASMAFIPRLGRRAYGGKVLFTWALLAWIIASIVTRKVAPAMFPAFAAAAVAIGVWLDELLGARDQADAVAVAEAAVQRDAVAPIPPERDASLRAPLVGLFVLLCAISLGKDLAVFPDRLVSLHILDAAKPKYPEHATFLFLELKGWPLLLGSLLGLALALGMWLWRPLRRRAPRGDLFLAIGRHGIQAALALSVVFGLFLSQVWTPRLSRALSSKHIFSVLREERQEGQKLGVMGSVGGGIEYYAEGDYEKLAGRAELMKFLADENRVFALMPAAELCAVHRAAGTDKRPYFVLDDTNTKFLLLSNQRGNAVDKNPLTRAIVREQPANIRIPLDIVYDDKVALIGADYPRTVSRGDSFKMTLYFKVLKPIGGNWKIFIHFDAGGARFQGDHDPINGRCGTSYWQEGDYVIDTFTVDAGNLTFATKVDYIGWVGFFTGGAGNWKNMPVSKGEKDSANRAKIPAVRLQ